MSDINFEAVQLATRKAFKGKLKKKEIKGFFKSAAGKQVKTTTATGSLYFAGIWGVITCTPGKHPYFFEEWAWGVGASAVSAGGVLFTAYNSWPTFYKRTNGYHAQGIAKAGGILQITFLAGSKPIGQFNAVAGGIGVFETGGSGKWRRK